MRTVIAAVATVIALGASPAGAEDWPEWRGAGRQGVWNETGILEKFPDDGLKVRWRTPIRAVTPDLPWPAGGCSSSTRSARTPAWR